MRIRCVQRVCGKQIAAFLLTGVLTLSLLCCSACTADNTSRQSDTSGSGAQNGLVIVASAFAPYDFSRWIVGDAAEVSLLVPPGAEIHSFEPSPQDIMQLNSADVFIYIGGESDSWLDKTISSLDNPDLTLIRLVDLVDTLEEEDLEGIEVDEAAPSAAGVSDGATAETDDDTGGGQDDDAGAHEHEIDEHVWTSVRNAQVIASYLATSFSTLDPEHEALFQKNVRRLNDELAALDERFTNIVGQASRTTLVFGDRFPFRYFAEDYGLTCYAAFPGCSTAVDTNPATISFLVDTVKEQSIPVVLYLELSDQRIARTISEETGAQMLLFHTVHNVSKEEFESGATYVSLMQANADTLEVALN